jgi:ribosomal-protein-alanine N-acetyltransferase
MTIEDIEVVYSIEKRSFATPWSKEAFIREVEENDRAYYFLVESDGVVAGYMGIWKILDEGHVTNIAIDPVYRGQKFGKALLEYALGEMELQGVLSFTLEVRETNQVAINLYESFGFIVAGRRKNYYADNQEDALLMWRNNP